MKVQPRAGAARLAGKLTTIACRAAMLLSALALYSAELAADPPDPPGVAPIDGTAPTSTVDELGAAADAFVAAIRDGEAFVRQHPFYQDADNRAAAQAFLAAMTLKAIEHDLVLDPDFPFFRVLDFRLREGGDNPDQTYFQAPLRGGQRYRIWGQRGSERRLDFQTYAGLPYAAGGGRMAGFLDSERLKVDRHGRFEVIVSPDPVPGNWLPNPPDGTQVLVRQVFSDWARERPGQLHIDRIGGEGDRKPALDQTAMARRLRAAAEDIRTHVRHWPDIVARGFERIGPNAVGAPFDAGPLGGVPGRWMARGNFDLAPDEALVIRTWPMPGNYQGIQLADLWYSSLEYANRQTSLTGDQARRSPDGSYWFVVSGRDPGVANWLDTMGHRRGVILFRFDGMNSRMFDRARWPTMRKVALSALDLALPAATPRIDSAGRAAEIAARRRHVQERLGR